MRRATRLAVACGLAVVLALVVMAVVTAMRHDGEQAVTQPFAADLADGGVLALVSLGPGSVGENEVHVFITPPGGSIVPVESATIDVTLDGTVVAAALVRESANHYSGTIDFPSAGDWGLDLVVHVDATVVAEMHTVVPVSAG